MHTTLETPSAGAAAGRTGARVPILRSLLSADGLAPVVEAAYGLEGARCQLIKAVLLDTYQVASRGGRFILRVYPAARRTLEDVVSELDILDSLHGAGLPVAAAIPTREGERFLALDAPEGTRYAVLFPFAPGQPLKDQRTPAQVRAFGTYLARLHQAADAMPNLPVREPLDLGEMLDGALADLERVFGPRSSSCILGRHAAEKVRPGIEALPRTAPVWGFSHGDTGAGNVLATQDGRLTLLDFDFCGPSWRGHDLAAFVNDVEAEAAARFLEGYQEVRPLEPGELETIPHFQVAHHLWVLGTRARNINEWGTWLFTEQQVIGTLSRVEKLLGFIDRPRR